MTPGQRAAAPVGVGWVDIRTPEQKAAKDAQDRALAARFSLAPARPAAQVATFMVPGNVRVKKNSLRRIRRGDRTFTVSSAAHAAWENDAVLRLQSQRHRQPNVKGWGLLNLRALIYLDREPGLTNLDNLVASVMDALQKSEVVADDCVIRGLDGCRIRIDRANPRVEITLTPLVDT